MRKILIATLVAAPLAGFAAYAFASNDGVSGEGNTVASPTTTLGSPFAGKPGLHKRLSIKGVVIEDDNDGNGTDTGVENDD